MLLRSQFDQPYGLTKNKKEITRQKKKALQPLIRGTLQPHWRALAPRPAILRRRTGANKGNHRRAKTEASPTVCRATQLHVFEITLQAVRVAVARDALKIVDAIGRCILPLNLWMRSSEETRWRERTARPGEIGAKLVFCQIPGHARL